MQYTNNILDLLVTIGYNIQSTVAYHSTGMELRGFFQLRSNAITGSSSALRFVAHSILYYDNVEAYNNEYSSNAWLVRQNQLFV